MEIELIDSPSSDLLTFFDKKIEEFNQARWEVKEKNPVAVRVLNTNKEIVAGAAGKTFGLWMIIENLWVHDSLR